MEEVLSRRRSSRGSGPLDPHRAGHRSTLEDLARRSRFGGGELVEVGIGWDLRLARKREG